MDAQSSRRRGASVGEALLALILTAVISLAKAQDCPGGCWIVKDYWPFKTCKQECDADVCKRGWGAWQSQELCCSPGVAFPEGCSQRPSECWVVENLQLRTCIRDDRKCLQGYGVFPSQTACCTPGAAFPQGCQTNLTKSAQPCWVVDTYFPARLCRTSDTLCTPESNVQSWPTQQACCASAFSEGCSPNPPKTPCFVVDSYWPQRTCRQESDIATCSRGWGVFQSQDVCCAPGVAFPEGCSVKATPIANTTLAPGGLSVPATNAVVQAQAALTAQAGDPALSSVPGTVGGLSNATFGNITGNGTALNGTAGALNSTLNSTIG